MRQGNKVLYVTLELSGRKMSNRFDQLVTRRSTEYIRARPHIVYQAIKKLKRSGGGLLIKDSTATNLSTQTLAIYLERIRKDFQFDVIIVDQVDLMNSAKEFRERRHELSALVIALRRLGAVFKVPVWTASQATRIAGAAGETTLWDIAEDIGKANWADVILTLSQNPEEKKEGILWMDTAKNRIGFGNPRVCIAVNYKKMKVKEYKDALARPTDNKRRRRKRKNRKNI